jgi:hypothetical protein
MGVRRTQKKKTVTDAPPRHTPHEAMLQMLSGYRVSQLVDINMLVIAPGGLERTREEFRELLARAGLRLRRVVPTTSRMKILEGVAA